MATSNPNSQFQAFAAGEDLSTKQNHFVKLDSNGKLVVATDGERGFPLVDYPSLGEYGTFQIIGRAKIVAGDAIAVWDDLTSDSQGRAVTADTGDAVSAIALEAASAAGEVIACLITSGAKAESAGSST